MAIPADIEEMWGGLQHKVAQLHAEWHYYLQLYGTSRRRVDVLNKSAANFFHDLHWILLDHVQLTLAKIGDSERMGRHDNLVIQALASKIEARGDHALASKLKDDYEVFKNRCEPIRVRRNKRIAHFDLAEMERERDGLATGPSRDEIRLALEALSNFMNSVQHHYCRRSTLYDLTVTKDDAESMVLMLAKGLRYSELIESDEIPREDIERVLERLTIT